jgi:putative permease
MNKAIRRNLHANYAFIKVTALVVLLVAGFWALWHFSDLLVILIASALTAFVLEGPVRLLEFRFGMRRGVAIGLAFLVFGGITAAILINGIPLLVSTIHGMTQKFRTFPFDEKLSEAARNMTAGIPFMESNDVVASVHRVIASGREWLGAAVGAAVGIVVDLLVVPFVVYFILAEGDNALRAVIERVPNKYFEMTMNVIHKIRRDLSSYLKGWILESLIVGVLSMAGLWIIGVPYPILIGAIAGVANLMPYLGPVVGASLAILASLMQTGDFRMLVPILILSGIIRLTDDFIIQPLCFAKSADMHPLMVILTLIAANELIGVLGMVIAIPVAIILKASAGQTYWGLKNYTITA